MQYVECTTCVKFLYANEGIKDTANQEGYTSIYLLQNEVN